MNASTENVTVHMVRPNLRDLPTFATPHPYKLRLYRPGDGAFWTQIHIQADPFNTFSDDTFRKQFGDDLALLQANQFYLCDGREQPIGTASAWTTQRESEGRPDGLVHWVAIHPDHQGKGLSKPLLSAVCHRLAERRFERVFLTTSSARLPAIALYLAFGFVPDIRKPEQRDVWRRIQTALGPRASGIAL